jgi:hypothetical protein
MPKRAEADTVIASVDANSATPIIKIRFTRFFLPTAGLRFLQQVPAGGFVPPRRLLIAVFSRSEWRPPSPSCRLHGAEAASGLVAGNPSRICSRCPYPASLNLLRWSGRLLGPDRHWLRQCQGKRLLRRARGPRRGKPFGQGFGQGQRRRRNQGRKGGVEDDRLRPFVG